VIDAADSEEERAVAVVWIYGSDAGGSSDAVCRILGEVVSGIFDGAVEVWFKTWL
jgi:tripartite-type tricarboxylate transporter receptor subunit TctC